jgi:hypothetical protein
MTRLEAYQSQCVKFGDEPLTPKDLCETRCPNDYDLGDSVDDDSKDMLWLGYWLVIGCRGITCEDCWGKEYDEG